MEYVEKNGKKIEVCCSNCDQLICRNRDKVSASATTNCGFNGTIGRRFTPKKELYFSIQKEDVWGDYEKHTKGMVVAGYNDKCPIWKDIVPYKSVTVVCDEEQYNEVTYWLSYVHGGDNISKEKKLKDGRIAIRSDYQCW